jgi:hypothetical protein
MVETSAAVLAEPELVEAALRHEPGAAVPV